MNEASANSNRPSHACASSGSPPSTTPKIGPCVPSMSLSSATAVDKPFVPTACGDFDGEQAASRPANVLSATDVAPSPRSRRRVAHLTIRNPKSYVARAKLAHDYSDRLAAVSGFLRARAGRTVRRLVVTLVVSLIAMPAAQAATTKQLQREVKSLKAQLKTAKRQRDDARTKLAAANQENAGLKGQVPDQVRAIAREDDIAQLFNLVIVPAHDVWPCSGSLFYGETFWSADFDRHTSDGGCY